MPIFFGRKNKVPMNQIPHGEIRGSFADPVTPLHSDCHLLEDYRSRLVDLRNPEVFRTGFIPGSYNVPDLACVVAARRLGLFDARKIFLLADDPEQLQLCSEGGALGHSAEMAGWFGPDAIQEWQKMYPEIGSLEAISYDTLSIRMAAWNTLIFDIHEDDEERTLSHPAALRFRFDDLPLSLDGLPAESSICLTARTNGMASFAASLLWNFGFHKVSYLSGGCRMQFSVAS